MAATVMAGLESTQEWGDMDRRRPNADNRLYEKLVSLKTHLRSCNLCRSARKVSDPRMMCDYGLTLVLGVAEAYDGILDIRIKARRNGDITVVPCPKPSLHGKTFELTYIPVVVVGYQDRLL